MSWSRKSIAYLLCSTLMLYAMTLCAVCSKLFISDA